MQAPVPALGGKRRPSWAHPPWGTSAATDHPGDCGTTDGPSTHLTFTGSRRGRTLAEVAVYGRRQPLRKP